MHEVKSVLRVKSEGTKILKGSKQTKEWKWSLHWKRNNLIEWKRLAVKTASYEYAFCVDLFFSMCVVETSAYRNILVYVLLFWLDQIHFWDIGNDVERVEGESNNQRIYLKERLKSTRILLLKFHKYTKVASKFCEDVLFGFFLPISTVYLTDTQD